MNVKKNLACADLLDDVLAPTGMAVTDPATGETIAHVRETGEAAVEAAIEQAAAALPAWKMRTAKDRQSVLRRWHDLIMARADDLAALMTAEQGKPLAEARGEVEYGASFIRWFADEACRVYGDTIPAESEGKRIVVIKQPVGVVAAITPWNFPIAMITRKIAPALAAGCTALVKPAEATPLCALAIARLAYDGGLPRECLATIISSEPARVGRQFCASETVRKLSFTGSTAVGKTLMEWCAPTVKRLSLELGGNAPFIVFEDADLDLAVKGLILAKFRNGGQTCICANRILVADAIYDSFIRKFADAVAKLTVGPGTRPGIDIGPLISEQAIMKVERLAEDAKAKGAKLVGGGRINESGHFIRPGILTDATREMALAQEEVFGPLAPVFRFRNEAEAIALANDTRAGLAAYFYARDISRAWRVAEALEYGMVGINEAAISTAIAPFGGMKESGFGREGSKYGIQEYLDTKYLCFGVTDG